MFMYDCSNPWAAYVVVHIHDVVTFLERCSKCEANGKGPLFQGSLAKHQKICPHDCNLNGNPQTFPLVLLQMSMYET